MSSLVVNNPYTQQTIQELSWDTPAQIEDKVRKAARAFEKWKFSASFDRSEVLIRARNQLEARRKEFARCISEEAGKPIGFAEIEVDRALSTLRWAIEEIGRFTGELVNLDTTSRRQSGFGIHRRFPRGIILGITPFNFPLNLVLHKVAPAIASGNVILIKPSPFTPLTALKLQELFQDVPGLVQVTLANDREVAKLTRAQDIRMISFTGSAAVGRRIREQNPHVPVTLELGGNAWCIVSDKADEKWIPGIAKEIATGAFGYAGQSCISIQNIAVHEKYSVALERELIRLTQELPFGDPSQKETVSGPVIQLAAAERIRSLTKNLEPIAISSHRIGGPSETLIEPKLYRIEYADVNSPQVAEEVFAPVANLMTYSNFEKQLSIVNLSRYGLQSGVFTRDIGEAQLAFRTLDVGGVCINQVPTTRYDHQPYGGVKDSGSGREGLRYAMEEMTESKFLALLSEPF